MADAAIHNVLFLCTGNSARSILAEALLNRDGEGRFRAYSAGSQPKGEPHPMALTVLREKDFDTVGLRSKSWTEFSGPDAPQMDLIITVCDNAAGETCPHWPGHPATAHWGYADPSDTTGSDTQRLEAFTQTLIAMRRRLELLVSLPRERLQQLHLQQSARDLSAR